MGVFTFVCKSSGKVWSGNQYSGDLEASASSTFELQRKLVQAARKNQKHISTFEEEEEERMGVFTFICKSSGKEWSGKQYSGDLEASASSTFELQRKLVQAALSADSSGGVSSSFSLVTPSSAVFQVIVGGGFIGGGGAAVAASSGGGAAAAEAPAAEEKKEEKEESDDDMGFSLFD